ncbi:hypothetical protein SDC9_131343 [bioreactor metagenome]|uniref:Uncharacterized protein n=1 Tax=bioreactor metagenome TaxID=1076179 RepID=A0A645D6L1_9ZZZZ
MDIFRHQDHKAGFRILGQRIRRGRRRGILSVRGLPGRFAGCGKAGEKLFLFHRFGNAEANAEIIASFMDIGIVGRGVQQNQRLLLRRQFQLFPDQADGFQPVDQGHVVVADDDIERF